MRFDAPSDGTRRWFLHGDVAQGNMLLDGDGQLGAPSTSAHVGSVPRGVTWQWRGPCSPTMATGIPRRATCLSTYVDPDEPAQFAEAEQVLDTIFRDAVSSGCTDAQRPDAVFR